MKLLIILVCKAPFPPFPPLSKSRGAAPPQCTPVPASLAMNHYIYWLRSSFSHPFIHSFIHSFIFILAFPLERVALAAALLGLEIPHGFQQAQIVLLNPLKDGTKWDWRLFTPSFMGHSGDMAVTIVAEMGLFQWFLNWVKFTPGGKFHLRG